MLDSPGYISSDEEFSSKEHAAILKHTAAAYGKKFQRIQAPDRNEPSTDVSEFHLSDKSKEKFIKSLAGSLQDEHTHVAQKVIKVKCSSKPLPAPLERPEAEKIKRSVAYENARNLLSRWEPVVMTNKVTQELHFPLNTPYFKMASTKDFIANFKPQSELEKEVDRILSGIPKEKEDKEKPEPKKTFFLNRKEILEQRRELARIRAQQSYREAKARRQNKIKSKKYHRILRREKIRKQIQEFEKLQKTDPEAALKKLEELEKTRAEERVSLRHRSTGQWARSKAVHAKYDKEARQQLHQQLRMSRDLTVKLNKEESSDGEDTEDDQPLPDSDNPWMKATNEYEEFSNEYRKYWEEQNAKKSDQHTMKSEQDKRPPVWTKEISDLVASRNSLMGDACITGKEMLKRPSGVEMEYGFKVSDIKERPLRSLKRRNSFDSVWNCTVIKTSSKLRKVKSDDDKDEDDLRERAEITFKSKPEKMESQLREKETAGNTKETVQRLNGMVGKAVKNGEVNDVGNNTRGVKHPENSFKSNPEKMDSQLRENKTAGNIKKNLRLVNGMIGNSVKNGEIIDVGNNARDVEHTDVTFKSMLEMMDSLLKEKTAGNSKKNLKRLNGMIGNSVKNGEIIDVGNNVRDVEHSEVKFKSVLEKVDSLLKEKTAGNSKKNLKRLNGMMGNAVKNGEIIDMENNARDVEDLFEHMENVLKNKFEKKASQLKGEQATRNIKNIIQIYDEKKGKIVTKSETQMKENISDVEIINETNNAVKKKCNVTDVSSLNLTLNGIVGKVPASPSKGRNDAFDIDPNNFIRINEIHLKSTKVPDIIANEEDNTPESEQEKLMTISEAFRDDDVIAEFRQEKEAIADKDKPKDIDLTLPGWGEWAGAGIVASKKKKRFIVKAPKFIPRKDDNKDSVIISEKSDSKTRLHQVNELPYPYIVVETFEKSVRAAVGSTWVPETAHRKFIAPRIKTLTGTVIEPLSEDALISNEEDLQKFDEKEVVYELN